MLNLCKILKAFNLIFCVIRIFQNFLNDNIVARSFIDFYPYLTKIDEALKEAKSFIEKEISNAYLASSLK